MILSARFVRRPRRRCVCAECGRPLGAHIRLYGRGDDYDPFSTLRLCPGCINPGWATREPKIAAALAAAQEG